MTPLFLPSLEHGSIMKIFINLYKCTLEKNFDRFTGKWTFAP